MIRKVASIRRPRSVSLVAPIVCLGILVMSLTAGLVLAPQLAGAATGPWAKSDFVSARLLSAAAGTGALATVPLGLEIKLDEGWKTYWRSPGDAGLPPQLSWAGSANLHDATLLYPKPQRLTLLGLQTFGYKHAVIFPIDGHVTDPGHPLDLHLKLDLLVCAELCVPRTLELGLQLPATAATPDPEAQVIAMARAAVPTDAASAGLSIASVEEVSDKGGAALEIKAAAIEGFDQPDLIAEVTPPVSFGLPRTTLSSDRRTATILVPLGEALPIGASLSGRTATLTLIDGDRGLEHDATIAKGASAAAEEPGPSLLAMIGIALLGGLILNLMPCVLPVLSLKILSVVSQGGRAPSAIRAGFLATAAGIVASFLGLAAALIAVKSAGRTIGWGLQFQEPAFIAGMAMLVTLFACHMWGLFEVPLPRFAAEAASRRLGPDESLAGHFVTGAFATLLATPCSAPFLGTAVGFALAGDIAEMLAIFLALGFGLASPYLLVAAVPQLAARMPKPGRWMLRVKQAMGFALIATAAWLVSILITQTGVVATGLVVLLLIAVVAVLALRGHVPAARRGLAGPVIILLALTGVVVPVLVGAHGRSRSAANDAIAWHSFDRGEIKSLVSQGKTVFVDVTADWCLTCQANKRLVLSQGSIAHRLNTAAVSMQADWTQPNPAIAAYLAQYGRYGIPFNIVYGPAAPSGIVLPELLSSDLVKGALDKASEIERRTSLPIPPVD